MTLKANKPFLYTAGVIVATAVILAVSSSWNEALIVDEIPHVGAGYSYLAKGDMRLNPEHPPLAKDLAALPLMLLDLNQSAFQTRQWFLDVNGQWEFGRALIFGSGNDADTIRRLARLPVLLFFLLSAFLACRWALKRYGDTGALIALILLAFSPTVMAHARFVTTDVAAMFGVLYGTYFFIRYLQMPTRKNMIIAGLVFGVALLTKFSTFLLVPFFGLLAMIYGAATAQGDWGKKLSKAITEGTSAVIIFIIGFVVIVWPVYYLHTMKYPPERQRTDTAYLLGSLSNRAVANAIIWASDKPVFRAAGHYALGLAMVGQRSVGGNTIYYLGEVRKSGGPTYFPLVYFLKEPLAWWVLVVIALLTWVTRINHRERDKRGLKKKTAVPWIKQHLPEFAMALWLVIYWGVSIKSNLNIGVRHLLPTYPFAILLITGQIAAFSNRLRKIDIAHYRDFTILIALLLGWYAFENVRAWPSYVPYFNQVAGGPSGGSRYVTDSNLDWGQDLIRLAQWTEENNIQRIDLDYFGWSDPTYYLNGRYAWVSANTYRDARDFIKRNSSDGWIAVSATFFRQASALTSSEINVGNYHWLLPYEPVAVIGNSIFVWHITK